MVSGTGPVWVERGGRLERTERRASRARRDLREAIERILAPLGRRVDEAEPLVRRAAAGRLARERRDPAARARRAGADDPPLPPPRVHARGPGRERHAHAAAAGLPRAARCARARRSSSAAAPARARRRRSTRCRRSSGRTERVVTIEDAAELALRQPHVVRLEARPPNVEGRGEVTIRRLVRNALRMRPDRIVVGEVRGRRGAGPADRALHRPRRLALDRARGHRRPRRCGASRRSR